jgi:RNA polymerase sigma-54 factor
MLVDHLLGQFVLTSPTADEEKMGSLIAGSLDADGYLKMSVVEIAEINDCPPDKV